MSAPSDPARSLGTESRQRRDSLSSLRTAPDTPRSVGGGSQDVQDSVQIVARKKVREGKHGIDEKMVQDSRVSEVVDTITAN